MCHITSVKSKRQNRFYSLAALKGFLAWVKLTIYLHSYPHGKSQVFIKALTTKSCKTSMQQDNYLTCYCRLVNLKITKCSYNIQAFIKKINIAKEKKSKIPNIKTMRSQKGLYVKSPTTNLSLTIQWVYHIQIIYNCQKTRFVLLHMHIISYFVWNIFFCFIYL